jgi:hypothetical protein
VTGFFVSLEASALAARVRDSLVLTAGLSAVHVIGFTLIMGGALLSNLRLVGAIFRDRPIAEVVLPGTTAIFLGLAISVPTGALLFSARATAAAANSTFQLKMLLIVLAVTGQTLLIRPTARHSAISRAKSVALGGVGLSLWVALALTACAYILLE